MVQSTLKRYGVYGGAGIFGGVVGRFTSWWGKRAAEAAVRVRPSLADVEVFDAFLAGHFLDWLYYHYPTAMSVFVIILTAVVFVAAAFMVVEG